MSFILYIPSLGNRPVWDDTQLLSGEGIGGASIADAISKPFLGGYFRPLVSITVQLENKLFGGNTFFYHLFNVLLHVASCALLMGLLLLCFQSKRIAALGGAIFAIHPMLVSSLAWIGGITDALATLLVVIFLYTLALGVTQDAPRAPLWFGISTVSYLLALFCKEQTIALIVLIPFAPWALANRDVSNGKQRALVLSVPYVVATIIFLILWKMYFPGYPDVVRTLVERVQTVGETLAYFTLLLLLPTTKWMQTYTLGAFEQGAWIWTILGLGLVVAFVWAWFRILRVDRRLAWFAALLFLSLVPVANILPPPSVVIAPYRAAISILGFSGVFGILVGRYARSQFAMIVVGLYFFFLASLTYVGVPQWSDQQTLFSSIVDANPDFLVARRNLAYSLVAAPGDPQANARDATDQLVAVLDQIYGSKAWQSTDGGIAALHSDHAAMKQLAKAKGPMNGDLWLSNTFVQLGQTRTMTGDFAGSRQAYQAALAFEGTNFTAIVGMAQVAARTGNGKEAIQYLQLAHAVRPDDETVNQLLLQIQMKEKGNPR